MKPLHSSVSKFILPTLMLIILSAVLACPAGALDLITDDTQVASAPYVSDSFFVKYPPAANGDVRLPGINTDAPAEILWDYSGLVPGLLLVKVQDGYSVEDAVTYYADLSGVEYAEPNYLSFLCTVPNDQEYLSKQWGLHNPSSQGGISAESAWDISTGNDAITVAVVDTGIDLAHPDLAAHVWTNKGEKPNNNIDDDGNGYIDDVHGWNFFHNNPDLSDYATHGSHCAGIIGAVTNNSEGIAGTAWNVTIMPVKVFAHTGSTSTATIIKGIEYAVNNNADIISLSLGGRGDEQAYKDAIDAAGKKGILCVCAAGNDNMDNDKYPCYPASCDSSNILAVAASDSNNNRVWFSNWGKTSVDIAAPGVMIYSTIPNVATNCSFVEDFGESDVKYLGSSWDRGYHKAYINGMNCSLIYSNTSISPSSLSKLLSADWWFMGNISENQGFVEFLVSNKSFREYRDIEDFVMNCTGVYPIAYITKMNVGWNQQHHSSGFTVDDMKIGDGPYYLGVIYYSINPDDYFQLVSWGFTYDYAFNGSTYGYMSGTSMATPMVAGSAALMKSVNPWLTPEEIIQIVIDTADKSVGNLSDKTVSQGRLNLSAALMKARSYTGPAYVEVSTWDQLVANVTRWTNTTAMRTIVVTGDVKNTTQGSNYRGIPVTGNITITTAKDIDATIDANQKGRLFNVTGGTLRLIGNGTSTLTLTNGTMFNAGAVMVDTGNLTISSGVNITDCTATNCGGAVFVEAGSLTMDGGNITGCSAVAGGGVFVNVYGKYFDMTAGSITDCTVSNDGGGVKIHSNSAEFNVHGSATITGNTRIDDDTGIMSDNNLYLVSAESLNLTGPFTGTVGIVYPNGASGAKFGTYVSGCEAYAKNFLSDASGYFGNATDDDLVWTPINTTAPVSDDKAVFGGTNTTVIDEAESSLVSAVVLEDVSNLTGVTSGVTFNATNATPIYDKIPTSSGYKKNGDVAVFDIGVTGFSGEKALINLTVTFASNKDAAANKDKVSVWHYNTAENKWDEPKLTLAGNPTQKDEKVTYTVETSSFSPFGISIESKESTPYVPSSGGSKQTGSTVILQEGEVAPTQVPTATPTPTAKPTVQPIDNPTVKPTTQQTQKSPAPFVGIAAGLGAAVLLIRMRR